MQKKLWNEQAFHTAKIEGAQKNRDVMYVNAQDTHTTINRLPCYKDIYNFKLYLLFSIPYQPYIYKPRITYKLF